MHSVTIEFDPMYDDYAGAFFVKIGEHLEECPTLDDALCVAKTMMTQAISE